MNQKISVILTVWNGENYLGEAIESILKQDYDNKEVIIINDGSSDRTQEIIDQFGRHIHSISQENQGLGASRNRGIEAATGEYLAFLDHDDLWTSTKLSLQMRELLQFSDLDPLLFSHVEQFICPSLSVEERKKISVNQEPLPAYFAGTLLISSKRFHQIGYFNEKKQLGEFVEWYLKVVAMQIPVKMMSETTLYRRVHQTNMGRRKDLYNQTDYLKIIKANLDRKRAQ